jgi:eukaryotic-like serine/threonine-protein kinase
MTEDTTKHDRWEWISGILVDALQISDPNARDAFVRERCGEDAEALREIRSLLVADTKFATTLEGGGIASAARSVFSTPPATIDEVEAASAHVGKRLGAYEIVGIIAVGGMGAVYKAKRVDASYEALVAVKIMRADLSAKTAQTVLARFRAERQMLANLNHPNITKIVDGGSTDEGLPYFVMEYVDGEPIDRFCESRGLPVAERLQKFRDVLSAVHYAHQRLIVHRDLKPNNILVDKNGVVKLLDFGIARLLDPESSGAATSDGGNATTMLAMTPAYASPEQVKSEAITTASDVYSLGVVLYRLLTGVSPYKSKNTQPLELAREIAETDPERPSTAITAATRIDPLANDAETKRERTVRNIDVARLKKTLRGDLDNIVLMALRKDPARRYASAEQFSEDIRRYLAHEPVIAHADSLAYRANKFVRRNRWSVAFASIAVVGLIGGITATTYQAKVARDAQALAEAERARAEKHFASVRGVVNDVLFATHDRLANISGTTAIRTSLIENATRYLEKLSREDGALSNASILREAGNGWLRLANIHGQTTNGGSTANIESARVSYGNAVDYLVKATNLEPRSAISLASLVLAQRTFGVFLSNQGDAEASKRLLTQSVETGSRAEAGSITSARLKKETAVALVSHVFYVRGNTPADYARYREYGSRARAMLEKLVSESASPSERRDAEDYLRYAYGTLAQIVNTRDDGSVDNIMALEWATAALELARQRFKRDEKDLRSIVKLAESHGDVGGIAKDLENFPLAIEHRKEQIRLQELQAASDSGDEGILGGIFNSLAALAESQFEAGNVMDAEASINKARSLLYKLSPAFQNTFDNVVGKMTLEALNARLFGRRAAEPGLSARESVAFCTTSVASYNSAVTGRKRWEEFYRRSMDEIFAEIRSDMQPCKALVKNFPEK